LTASRPLNCRGGCYFWLGPKVTKRPSQQKGFFAARGLCAANQAKPGRETVAPPCALLACALALAFTLLQIFPMPCRAHWPPLFCLISAEAVLLTGLFNITAFSFDGN